MGFPRLMMQSFPVHENEVRGDKHKQTELRAVQLLSKIKSGNNISKLLLQNINEPLRAGTQLDRALAWRKIFINFTYIYKERNCPARREIVVNLGKRKAF